MAPKNLNIKPERGQTKNSATVSISTKITVHKKQSQQATENKLKNQTILTKPIDVTPTKLVCQNRVILPSMPLLDVDETMEYTIIKEEDQLEKNQEHQGILVKQAKETNYDSHLNHPYNITKAEQTTLAKPDYSQNMTGVHRVDQTLHHPHDTTSSLVRLSSVTSKPLKKRPSGTVTDNYIYKGTFLEGTVNNSQEGSRPPKIYVRQINEINNINKASIARDFEVKSQDIHQVSEIQSGEFNVPDSNDCRISNQDITKTLSSTRHLNLANPPSCCIDRQGVQHHPPKDFIDQKVSTKDGQINDQSNGTNKHSRDLYYFQQQDIQQRGKQQQPNKSIGNEDRRPNHQNVRINESNATGNASNVLIQQKRKCKNEQLRQNIFNHQDPQPNACAKRRILPSSTSKEDNLLDQSLVAQKIYSSQNQLNERTTDQQNNINPTATLSKISTTVPMPTTPNFNVPSAASSYPSNEPQLTVTSENNVYRNPCTPKMVIDRSTETCFVKKHNNSHGNVRSPCAVSSPEVMACACQLQEHFMEKPLSSTHQLSSSVGLNNIDDYIRKDSSLTETKDRTAAGQTCASSVKEQQHSTGIVGQQMLFEFEALFRQMGETLCKTWNMLKKLTSSINASAVTYQRLIEAVKRYNELRSVQAIAGPSSKTAQIISQILKEAQCKELDNENSDNNNESNNVTEPRKCYPSFRDKLILPSDYNANDTKWTLKHKQSMPGLVEIIPETGIYVNSFMFEYCIRVSKDSETLAPLLLTEIFSESALSVCSLKDMNRGVFQNENAEVRPRLNDYALMVLLVFVEKHRSQQGWSTSDMRSIISSLNSKIQEMRDTFGQ